MVDSDDILHLDGTEESDIEEEQDQDQDQIDEGVDSANGEPMEHEGEEPMEHDGEEDSGLSARALEYLMDKFPVLQTREGRAGLVHNFLRGLQLMSAPVPSGKSKSVPWLK